MKSSRTVISVWCLVLFSVFFFSVSDAISQPFTRFELVRASKTLEFAAIGDPHYGWTHNQHAGDIVHSWMTNEAAPDISFAFNMGDYTHFGSPEGWKYAMQHSFNNMFLPWMMVFGNHDTDDYKTGTGRDLYGNAGGHASKDVNNTPYQAVTAGQRNSGLLSRNYAFSWNNILFLVFG
ncbi:MAG: metallophosphoesterase family protein, partial [Calditrichota bacterium]